METYINDSKVLKIGDAFRRWVVIKKKLNSSRLNVFMGEIE